MLLVKTMKGSGVMAKIAGIESTAKIRSVTSTRTSASSRGVAAHLADSVPGGAGRATYLPSTSAYSTGRVRLVKNLWPS